MRRRRERWLRGILAAISVATVISGAVQLVAPGFELGFLRAESTATSRHFFGIVGMFMVFFGGLLLHALVRPKENPAAFVWAGLQKLGACVAVSLGVARGLLLAAGAGSRGLRLSLRAAGAGLPRPDAPLRARGPDLLRSSQRPRPQSHVP